MTRCGPRWVAPAAAAVAEHAATRTNGSASAHARATGRYLVIGFAGGSIPRLPLNHVLLQNRTLVGVDWGAWSRRDPEHNQALVADLLDSVAAGRLHPVLPTAYPLERAAKALNMLAGRRVTGKLALLP